MFDLNLFLSLLYSFTYLRLLLLLLLLLLLIPLWWVSGAAVKKEII
ncbi:MAG: hypothetical protein N7Q72_03990 [Spiroplasma sp. Tabriz.8]|nr:hypothetical protein [Candidatus Regiella insecticola]MCZ8632406.1 hypothetical protein [Spiroplasma sp. Tabriz.8]